MRLIKPSFEILEQPKGLEGIIKMIEIAGRTCYKSEDKITEDSATKFVGMLIDRNHTAMLEHGTVYLKIPYNLAHRLTHPGLCRKYCNNPYSKVEEFYEMVEMPHAFETTFGNMVPYLAVTTNYRVLVENGWLEDLKYLCEPTQYHPKRVTVRFITDRGVSHEIVRHRVMSFAQESTRYCNYSKDKFGNELSFIIPTWAHNLNADSVEEMDEGGMTMNEKVFITVLENSEASYLLMLANGATPQEARQVLPNALKTEIIVTGFISDWNHFFDLRARGRYTDSKGREWVSNPHPDMKALAEPLMGEFYKRGLI